MNGGPHDVANPRLEKHMIFICPECGKEHESQQDWRRHLNEVHAYINKTYQDFDFKEINDRYHECLVCRRWVANAHQAIALLQYHRFLHLPHSRTYRCRHCLGAFTRKRALCEHLHRFHSRVIARIDKKSPQQQLPKPSAVASTVINPNTITTEDSQRNPEFYLHFLCPQCGDQFNRCEEWTQHIDTAHPSTSTDLQMHRITGSRNHYCLQCKKLVYTSEKARLQRHRFTHLPHKLYFKCAHCLVRKTFKTEVLRHYIFAHACEFEANKAHVRLPDEWGGQASDRLRKELEQLLLPSDVEEDNDDEAVAAAEAAKDVSAEVAETTVKTPQPDLLQKALLDSLIDLENETLAAQKHKQPLPLVTTKSSAEYALDQSLNDLEAILRGDLQTTHQKSLIQHDAAAAENSQDSQDHELEELCAAIFEAEDELLMPKPIAAVKMESEIKHEIDAEEPEEEIGALQVSSLAEEVVVDEIISIEIDSIDENGEQQVVVSTARPDFTQCSPKRKRRKLSDSAGEKDSTASAVPPPPKRDPLETHINYMCPECGCEFAEANSWRKHVFSAHNLGSALDTSFKLLEDKSSYLCLDCMQVQQTTRNSDLQRHRFMHMPFQAYLKCTLCNKRKSSKPKMLHHLQSYHHAQLELLEHKHNTNETNSTTANANGGRRPRFKCPDCGKEFMQQTRWQNHRAQCDKRPPPSLRTKVAVCSDTRSRINENLRLLEYQKRARLRMQRVRMQKHIGA